MNTFQRYRIAILVNGVIQVKLIIPVVAVVILCHVASPVVGISFSEILVFPYSAFLLCPCFEHTSFQCIGVLFNPVRIIHLIVILREILDDSAFSFVVFPRDISGCIRSVVSDGIVAFRFVTSFQLVPYVVCFSVAISVFGYPYDARFGTSGEGIADNTEVVSFAVLYFFRHFNGDVSAERSQ